MTVNPTTAITVNADMQPLERALAAMSGVQVKTLEALEGKSAVERIAQSLDEKFQAVVEDFSRSQERQQVLQLLLAGVSAAFLLLRK